MKIDINDYEYKEIINGIFKVPEYEKTMIPLEALNKAHQAANGFVYTKNKDVHVITENKKLKILEDQLTDLLSETHKVIIVYLYQRDLEELETLPFTWTKDFLTFKDSDAQILFLQFAQSEGLNLQFCNQMIFYTYDYSFLNYDQMCGRIYRTGQKKPVTYTIYIAEDTIEEKVWKAISTKQSIDEFLKEALSGDG